MKCGKTQHLMHKVRGNNCSSCTCRSSENICSSSGSAQEKGKTVFKSTDEILRASICVILHDLLLEARRIHRTVVLGQQFQGQF
jgi:hypothetical protein